MKLIIQRVDEAFVAIDGKEIARIDRGLMILVGVVEGDTTADADILAKKCAELRIFPDLAGKMNLPIKDAGGEVLAISQFTLAADLKRGRRPSFDNAAKPDLANSLYERFCGELRGVGIATKQGVFAAYMKVSLVNDGPVTFELDSRELTK